MYFEYNYMTELALKSCLEALEQALLAICIFIWLFQKIYLRHPPKSPMRGGYDLFTFERALTDKLPRLCSSCLEG